MRSMTGLAVLASVALALAGCGETDDPGPDAAPGTTPSTAGPTGSQCVVGTWRATAVAASATSGPASARLEGGSGTELVIDPAGQTRIGFDSMQPITFTGAVAGADVTGEYRYHGTLTGAVTLAAGAESGRWQPTGTVDWSTLRASLRLTEPVQLTLLDNAALSGLPGDAQSRSGNAVDLQPLLREGTYRCSGDSLTVSPQASGPTVDWTFSRA